MKGRFRCYTCREPLSLLKINTVDRKIDDLSSDAYSFLIDALGLHGCDGPPNLFHGVLANICLGCFEATMATYVGIERGQGIPLILNKSIENEGRLK